MNTNEEVIKKLMRYCAYQERCHQEVRQKIMDLGVYGDDLEEIIAQLIQDNYLNEERFAISFAGGKFRQKQWGKNKIMQALYQRNISDYCINKAISEIDDVDYANTIERLVAKHLEKNSQLELILAKDKTLKYLTQARGFEIDLILSELRKY